MNTDHSFSWNAAADRLEQIVELMETRHIRAGFTFDRDEAQRALDFLRDMAECYPYGEREHTPKEEARFTAFLRFAIRHNQSLDWILSGDVGGMVCRLAAESNPEKQLRRAGLLRH